MAKDILEIIAEAKVEAEKDFTTFFLKNIAIYRQLQWNHEYDIKLWNYELRCILRAKSTLGLRHWEIPDAPNNDWFDFSKRPEQYDLINIFKFIENHKGMISKLGFEVYYLTEVNKLHEEVFRLGQEVKSLKEEYAKVQAVIDDYNHQEDLRQERRRKEEFAKAERLKERIKTEQEQAPVRGDLDPKRKETFEKAYKALGYGAKEHFQKIAPDEFKTIFSYSPYKPLTIEEFRKAEGEAIASISARNNP